MKAMKKTLCLALALIMVLALGAAAWAEDAGTEKKEETYEITISNKEGAAPVAGEYEAYQIFKGELTKDAEDNDVLSNIEWGEGINVTDEFKKAVRDRYTIESTVTDDKLAAAVAEKITDANALAEFLQAGGYLSTTTTGTYANGKITGLTAGYYLVKNVAGSIPTEKENTGLAYTDFIVRVVESVEVNPKGTVPSVTKKVDDKNDSNTDEDTVVWQDSADYDIGDDVPFQLTGTLPSNYADYDSYTYIFHDTLSVGLTYNEGSYQICINGDPEKDITDEFTATYSDTDKTLAFECANLKAEGYAALTSSDSIVVTYTAELNDKAVIGSKGNPNEVYLEYSNNPTNDGSGTTGHTPTDKVIVFTYQLVVSKVDKNQKPLEGAKFTLYKKDAATGDYKEVGSEVEGKNVYDETDKTKLTAVTFTWPGLDDGDYKIVETTTPAGYNTCDPVVFTVSATHETEADDPQLQTLTVDNGAIKVESTDAGDLTGNLTTSIVNNSGSVLPSTGGMGTTLFYVLGGIMIVAAGVILVVRRKVND